MKKSWRNFSKRGLSLLVCLVMCLSMLPGVAWAEGGLRCNYSGLAGVITCDNELTYVPQVDPTCRTEGIAAHYNCPSSLKHGDRNYDLEGNYLSDPVKRIPEVPCDYQLVSSTATCEKEGTATYACKWCGDTKEETTPATGNHTPGEALYESEADATCNTPGSCIKVVSCTVCSGEVSRETITGEIDPNNHDATGKLEWRPLDGGTHHGQVWSCCGAKVENSEQEHSYADGAPTCTTSVACDACGYTSTDSNAHNWAADWSSNASGHWHVCENGCTEMGSFAEHPNTTEVSGSATAATCEKSGKEADKKCDDCGWLFEGAVIERVGHDYGTGVWTFQTTRLNGSATIYTATGSFSCTKCNDVYSVKSIRVQNVKVKGILTCEADMIVTSANVTYTDQKGDVVTKQVDGTVKAPGHKWSTVWSISTTPKSHAKKCLNVYTSGTRCRGESEIAGHTTVYTEESAATCEEKGMYANRCTVCSVDTGYNASGGWIDPLGHKYGEPTWTWNGTQTAATATFTCGNDSSHVGTGTIVMSHAVTKDATCVGEGEITFTATASIKNKVDGEASVYTDMRVNSIPATGIHDYDEDGVCKNCGHVNPADHKHVYDMEKGTEKSKATCTVGGLTSYPCKYCEATLDVVSNPLGHEYSVTTKPATCVDLGVETHTCKLCNDSYTSPLPLVPHTLTVHAEKKPACTENGMKAHSTCSVCNGFFTGAGTSLEETAEDDLVILATNHTYEAVVTAPACTEGGYTTHTCTKCGDSYTDTQTNAIGHAYGAWTITAAPTMSAPGAARRVCANDASHVETVELPQLPAPGTPDSVWTLDTERSAAPTCTESGENMYVSVYGEVRANVPALGHSFSDTWTYDGASHWHACARCGIAGGAAAHAYDGGVVTLAPTADTAGVRTYTCTACGRYYTEAIPATGTTGPVFPAPDPGTPGGGSGGTNNPPPAETIIDEDTPLADITFDDVMPTDPFYEAVQYVFNRKLMNGVSDTSFDPYGTLTRAMVVTILYRLEGEPAAEPSAFLDVAAGQWYTDAVGWGAANKVVKGYSEDRFGPMDPVTREQLAAILHRYAQYKGYEVTEITDLTAYADMASISEYALEAMAWAIALGAPEALSETALAPRDNATRAQVAVAFMNFCEKYIPLETEGEAA